MEAVSSSETSVATQQTTRRRIPEDDTLHNHRCKNLKSSIRLNKNRFIFLELGRAYRRTVVAIFSARVVNSPTNEKADL
jgi:hypothetical protein